MGALGIESLRGIVAELERSGEGLREEIWRWDLLGKVGGWGLTRFVSLACEMGSVVILDYCYQMVSVLAHVG